MASEAQVQANRANAQKSTGPRSPAGKATVSANAVTHGLSGRRDVIKGEDQAEFDRQREALLKELRPDGAVESMLAERVVSLSWRLERVGRMQNEVFDALLADGAAPLAKLVRSMAGKKSEDEEELALGRAVIKDFANSRVLDRLLMYERRMENSLLKMLTDLHLRRLRVREYISRHMDEIGSSQEESFMCEVSSFKSEESGVESSELHTSHFQLPTSPEPPDGVTTNTPDGPDADRISATRATQDPTIPSFQDSVPASSGADADRMSATRVTQDSNIPSFQYSPDALEQSCKTKPICSDPDEGQAPRGQEVRNDSPQDGPQETNPIFQAAEQGGPGLWEASLEGELPASQGDPNAGFCVRGPGAQAEAAL
jgi:hypothetical protein